MRNIRKYADNEMYVMPENAHIKFLNLQRKVRNLRERLKKAPRNFPTSHCNLKNLI
jgi:hypothetical protein